MLRITHPEGDETWSAMDVCDGWAKKRGFLTARAARLDTYRAANSILRMALDGKICLCLYPCGFVKQKCKLVIFFNIIKKTLCFSILAKP